MNTENSTYMAQAATQYEHSLMSASKFDKLVELVYDGKYAPGLRLWADFYELEYMNSPSGLIIFAFHDFHSMESFYPTSFDFTARTGIDSSFDQIVPATNIDQPNFLRHSLWRRASYFVTCAAFGEKVPHTDPRIILNNTEFQQLDVIDSPKGLIVAAHQGRQRYVIHPVGLDKLSFNTEKKEAA